MTFDLDTWKTEFGKRIPGWRDRMRATGTKSVFAFVSASALWPVIEAFQQGNVQALIALGTVAAGAGTSLIAAKIKDWQDEAQVANELEKAIAGDNAIMAYLEAMLRELEALSQAQSALPVADREWFAEVILPELEKSAPSESYEATITGSGKAAQGKRAILAERHAIVVTEGATVNIYNQVEDGTKKAAVASMKEAYLRHVHSQVQKLSLSGIDPKAATGEAHAQLNLDAVYTALRTKTPESSEGMPDVRMQERQEKHLSALEQLNAHKHLVLLGDPGSGKSTFVNFVAMCMAGELLNSSTNLDLLTRPLPNPGEDEPKRQKWDHAGLQPVRVILKDFTTKGLPSSGKRATADHLWQFIADDLSSACLAEYAPLLKQELLGNGGIILLDGLDEVPEGGRLRVQIKQCVEHFASIFGKCRIVVTSRTYAYQAQEWRLDDFASTMLAPFDQAQIDAFVQRWYDMSAQTRGMSAETARGRATLLKETISKSERLKGLAERPLLLTLMASLHAWRGGSLPDKREVLYSDAVELLLDWWENAKLEQKEDGTTDVKEPSLAEWLNTDRDKIRERLNEQAFMVHACQKELHGTADIAEKDLVDSLMDLAANPDAKPGQLIKYLSERAGLLVSRGVGVYSFPHRTFQEYLAACHLTGPEYPKELVGKYRAEPNRWREVALLAAAKAYRGSGSTIWNLIDELWPEQGEQQMHPDVAWDVHLAGQALVETADLSKLSAAKIARVAEVKDGLKEVMRCNEFPAIERAAAGVNLARIGDPREEVTTLEKMSFCLVPGGEFWMGEDEALHCNKSLAEDYWISRYPVTNAQFRAFVQGGGYSTKEYWVEAKKAGLWSKNGFKGWRDDKPRIQAVDFGPPFNLDNHPCVGVSWYEALAFVRWLTVRMGLKSKGLQVHLPSEAEWEKAARGGLKKPEEPVVASLAELPAKPAFTTVENVRDKREFPWGRGQEINSNLANYRDTNINTTSAVGCFTQGRSACGCEEMSGNVWEWTRSLYSDYEYDPGDGREQLDSEDTRVVRGGAFGSNPNYVRCAYRYRYYPRQPGPQHWFSCRARPFL